MKDRCYNKNIGVKFNRLTVISDHQRIKGNAIWLCKCDCGKTTTASSARLKNGAVKSCGCLKIEKLTKHGLYKHKLYDTFRDMKDRCYNKNNRFYYRYGQRGIKVCDEWLKDFLNFYNWAISNGWRKELSIERKNNNRGYSPKNCCWATAKEQNRNTSRSVKYNGEHAIDAEKRMGFPIGTISRRKYEGWTLEKAFTTPVGKHTKS